MTVTALKKHLFISFLFCVAVSNANAQPQFSGWLASFNTFGLSKKLSLHFDAQVRSTDKWQKVRTVLLRPGLNYELSKSWSVSAGYAFISNQQSMNGVEGLLAEHRAWQQVTFQKKIKTIAITQRLRFEERFLPDAVIRNNELEKDGHNQAYRLRYYVRSQFPLTSQSPFNKGPYLALQDEVFLNTGNKSAVNGKSMDQNRLYGAAGYRVSKKIDVEAGYMNQYTVTKTAFTNNHILQIAVYKRL